MPKGYWIAHVDVTDPNGYKEYVALNAKAFSKYGAKFLVRGGQFTKKSGDARARHVVIEFETYERRSPATTAPSTGPPNSSATSTRKAT